MPHEGITKLLHVQRHVSVVHDHVVMGWSWVSLSTLPPHLCGPAAVLQLQMKLPASLLGPYIQPYAYGVWMGVAAAVCAAAAACACAASCAPWAAAAAGVITR